MIIVLVVLQYLDCRSMYVVYSRHSFSDFQSNHMLNLFNIQILLDVKILPIFIYLNSYYVRM